MQSEVPYRPPAVDELPDGDDEIVPEEHPLIPDDFIATMSDEAGETFETFEEAWSYAERRPSTTDLATMPRCPECGSTCVTKKQATTRRSNQKDGAKKCISCNSHFNDTDPPLEEIGISDAAHSISFEWIHTTNGLEDEPAPGFHEDLPDFEHGNRTEAIRRAIALTKPWSDDEGLTNREAARHIPKGRGFVNYHRQKWRNGEHDDLFTDDETATVDTSTPTATA